MAIQFPTSPAVGEIFESNGKTWVYDATRNAWTTETINAVSHELTDYYTKGETDLVAENSAVTFGIALS